MYGELSYDRLASQRLEKHRSATSIISRQATAMVSAALMTTGYHRAYLNLKYMTLSVTKPKQAEKALLRMNNFAKPPW